MTCVLPSSDSPSGKCVSATGSKGSPACCNEPPAGCNESSACCNEPPAGSNESSAGSNEPAACCNEPSAGSNEPTAGSNEPSAGSNEPSDAPTLLSKMGTPGGPSKSTFSEGGSVSDEWYEESVDSFWKSIECELSEEDSPETWSSSSSPSIEYCCVDVFVS